MDLTVSDYTAVGCKPGSSMAKKCDKLRQISMSRQSKRAE